MKNKWNYGGSWEKFPIEDDETWQHKDSDSFIKVHDIRDELPLFMLEADMIYSDTPWSQGNVNSFITKAGKSSYIQNFNQFMDVLFERIAQISPKVCYLEIGKQHKADFINRLSVLFPIVTEYQITYYRKSPCWLIRGGYDSVNDVFTGLDDEDTPLKAIQLENLSVVADLCTGRGLTMIATHQCGKRFVGTELNKRRLAVAIDRSAKLGVCYVPYNTL